MAGSSIWSGSQGSLLMSRSIAERSTCAISWGPDASSHGTYFGAKQAGPISPAG